jgi:hypothetical protein
MANRRNGTLYVGVTSIFRKERGCIAPALYRGYRAPWLQNASLVRNACDDAERHSSGKANKRRVKTEKAGVNRGAEPDLAGLV